MSEIVNELRRMCAVEKDQYEIAGTTYWTDGQLAGALAKRVVTQLLQAPVNPVSTVAEGGGLVALNGYVSLAGSLDVETAIVTGAQGDEVDGVTFYADGRLEFATDQYGHTLTLTGMVYDLNAAAADVLTDWAAAVKGGYDVAVDGQQMKRSQRHSRLLAQAERFRAAAVAGSVRMHRSDVRPSRRRRWRR